MLFYFFSCNLKIMLDFMYDIRSLYSWTISVIYCRKWLAKIFQMLQGTHNAAVGKVIEFLKDLIIAAVIISLLAHTLGVYFTMRNFYENYIIFSGINQFSISFFFKCGGNYDGKLHLLY